MLTLTNIPLSVYNRALDLYGEPPAQTVGSAQAALLSAQGRKDITPELPGISAFAQAIAEHMSGGDGYHVA